MQHYFAAFCPEHDGRFSVLFPDLPDVMTSGNDIDDAMTMARNVLRLHLENISRSGEPLPQPSSFEDARIKALALYEKLSRMPVGEVFFPLIAAPDMDRTPMNISLSLPRNAVVALDRKAAQAGMTLEGYITSLALS